MCDDEKLDAYLREADHHIAGAEVMLRGLTETHSTHMRQLRAAMYIKAMKRLRRLIEVHRTSPWKRAGPLPPADQADPARRAQWPVRWRGQGLADTPAPLGLDR